MKREYRNQAVDRAEIERAAAPQKSDLQRLICPLGSDAWLAAFAAKKLKGLRPLNLFAD